MKPVFLFVFIFISLSASAREKRTVLFPNGKVQFEYETEAHFFDGRFSSYYITGRLKMKGQYVRNQKTGLWRVWDEKGILRSERNYTDNETFTIVSESDSTGMKIKRSLELTNDNNSGFKDYLFSHRYISMIENNQVNNELFSEHGLMDLLLQQVMAGTLPAFNDDRFVAEINKPSVNCYSYKDVTGLMIKEEYYSTSSRPTLCNKLIGICPVILENGKKKELGWIFVPGINIKTEQLGKIQKQNYASTIVRSSLNDPEFKLRDMKISENEMTRLVLAEHEANIILYSIDREILVSK